MLIKLQEIKNYAPQARDGWVGKIEDFYFDDETWTLRYFVVEAGVWLLHRRSVLISPVAFGSLDEEQKIIHINLTQEQIGSSPPVDTTKPISRQYEEQLNAHYQWTPYWVFPFGGLYYQGGATHPGAPGFPPGYSETRTEAEQRRQPNPEDSHIRSTNEVKTYDILAGEEEVGIVEDFIVDKKSWKIRYLQIGTGKWWPSHHILLAPRWITDISWDNKSVRFDLSRRTIQTAPAYDPEQPVTEADERRIVQHYHLPVES